MPDINFNCPHCQQPLEAPPELMWKTIECPACGKSLLVPRPKGGDKATGIPTPSLQSCCPSCKYQMPANAVVCVNCGFNLHTEESTPTNGHPLNSPTTNTNKIPSKRWIKTEFDEFENKTSISYTLKIEPLFWGHTKETQELEREAYTLLDLLPCCISLRYVKTKDVELILINAKFANIIEKIFASKGCLTLNIEQVNFDIPFNEQMTESKNGFAPYVEYGFYGLPKDALDIICKTQALKMRFSTGYAKIVPDQDWCNKFQAHCRRFYNNVYDESAYVEEILQFIETDPVEKERTLLKSIAASKGLATDIDGIFSEENEIVREYMIEDLREELGINKSKQAQPGLDLQHADYRLNNNRIGISMMVGIGLVVIFVACGRSCHQEAERAKARVIAEQVRMEEAKAEREAQELKEKKRVENEAALVKKRIKDAAESARLRAEKQVAEEEAIAKRARLLKLVDEKVNAETSRALDPAKVAEELHLPYPLLSSGKTETEALHDAAEQIRQAVDKRIHPINYDELRARAEKDFVMYKRGDLIRVEWIAGVRRSPLTGRLEAVNADMFKLDGAWILSRDIDPELWEKISTEAHRVAVDKIVKRESVTYNERVICVEYELRDSVTTQVMLANGYYPMRGPGKQQILGWISGEEILKRELTQRREKLLPVIQVKIEMEILGTLDTTSPIGDLEPQPPLSGQDLCNRGVAASERGDHQQAVRYFIAGALAGHASCQFYLGAAYSTGDGIAKDFSESVKWFRKAAEQDIPEAQFNLGVRYYYGDGVEKNYSEAIKWLRKSARLGYEKARSTLQKFGENP